MEGIFGIGITEILLVFVLALILLGPRDMVGTARKMGRWVNRVIRSPLWREIVTTSQELRDLPVKIVREAGMEETLEELKKTGQEVKNDIGGAVSEVRQAELDAIAQARAAMHPEQAEPQPEQAALAAAPEVDPQQDAGVNPPAEAAPPETQAAPPAEAVTADPQQDAGVNPPAEVQGAEVQGAEVQGAETQPATPPSEPPSPLRGSQSTPEGRRAGGEVSPPAEITTVGFTPEPPKRLPPTGELPRFQALEPDQPDEYNI